ncbi:hypothetical protein [Bifidobacterium platyrrhinorum]|uniref:Uncharacterized protein n=1 Tax=Bifidobacterium platyrrhinorum TaxID=2661628 RepID=A0A6L9SPG6_9BIFI|nr:hypothetical protein [Bifidobacterium platyrrhinorum]NEG54418.1 hypothetical protein [Bifidobacterium platyrrhinorum]
MNERSVGRVSRISITRASSDGTVSRTEVRIAETRVVGAEPADRAQEPTAGECFDPSTCCSERERAMIAALRAYLRPETAPECLRERLRECLDHCCGER